jgi:hypothetical protein
MSVLSSASALPKHKSILVNLTGMLSTCYRQQVLYCTVVYKKTESTIPP